METRLRVPGVNRTLYTLYSTRDGTRKVWLLEEKKRQCALQTVI